MLQSCIAIAHKINSIEEIWFRRSLNSIMTYASTLPAWSSETSEAFRIAYCDKITYFWSYVKRLLELSDIYDNWHDLAVFL